MAKYAPIALFVYRRVDLLSRVLDALEACPEFSRSDVYVFSDGAKTPAVAADVQAVRALVRARLMPNMRLVEAPENKGLANAIIEGATRLCEEYGRVIVIEDDLIVSPAILTWFNDALTAYEDEQRVMQISGHMFNVPELKNRQVGVFLPITTSWGWATWRRAWNHFDAKAPGWENLETNSHLRRQFNMNGVYPYARMLRRQMNGQVDSWAIRWHWAVFIAEGLTLFPPETFVLNEGNDPKATHKSDQGRARRHINFRTHTADLPQKIEIDADVYLAVQRSIARARSWSKLISIDWLLRFLSRV